MRNRVARNSPRKSFRDECFRPASLAIQRRRFRQRARNKKRHATLFRSFLRNAHARQTKKRFLGRTGYVYIFNEGRSSFSLSLSPSLFFSPLVRCLVRNLPELSSRSRLGTGWLHLRTAEMSERWPLFRCSRLKYASPLSSMLQFNFGRPTIGECGIPFYLSLPLSLASSLPRAALSLALPRRK